jgi:hypothetical protein
VIRLHIPALAAALAFGPCIATATAQSLADVARKEEERRKTVKQTGKVYTNKELGTGSENVVSSPPPAAAASDAADAAAPESKEPVKDQAYWAKRMKGLRAQLDRNETYLAALQSRVNALAADFVNRDDPAQRAAIDTDRKKALAELASLQQQIVADKKAIADLEEEARRAGAPPGWLR